MKWLAVISLGLVFFWSVISYELQCDVPPRAARRTRTLRCDHCGERDAWGWCPSCDVAWCVECAVVHEHHAGVR